ncbi:integrin alpha-D-like [Hyperolius riggenbachi]|uniref:integrin alpha-D-like n=1 Tax=Hyperolius riggenbachi TaxID=752182 RepID=UPI0035A3AB3F
MMEVSLCWVLFPLVLSSTVAFFVDKECPLVFKNEDRSFGHQVAQLDNWVIVSSPLHRVAVNRTGQLYRCDPKSTSCTPIQVNVGSEDGINTSMGLSLAVQQGSSQILACGPTLQKTCGGNVYVNGRCYQLDSNSNAPRRTLPAFLPECPISSLDIVFLIDGSGSVALSDFGKTLTFVSAVMSSFRGTDAQFALMQYSATFETHFDFSKFSSASDKSVLTKGIKRLGSITRTATAIYKVVTELFVSNRGSRVKARKLLIVITDGVTFGDNRNLKESADEAKRRGIICFAIGVGNAFSDPPAYEELQTIASSSDHIFKVTDFSALSQFQKTLQDKIFAIEGQQSQDETSFQMEMAQEGFSAVLTQDGPILGAVGAYGWSGGVLVFEHKGRQQNGTWINTTKDQLDNMRDSYMGYAVQQVEKGIIAVGAPRYQHAGRVLIYKRDTKKSQWQQIASVNGEQIGSYFGSAMNVLPATNGALLVVGAPTYYSPDIPGGRVYLCPIQNGVQGSITITCRGTLQGDSNQSVGHFGSAISILPDVTGDQLLDLAIGAPCEDDYKGAVYIFPGQQGGFRSSYIQRISGSTLCRGVRLFGRSLSGNMDMTGDGLPDLTVGGESQVFILKSRPVIALSVTMKFSPPEIPLSAYDCARKARTEPAATVKVCFTKKLRSTGAKGEISAQVNFTLRMDAGLTQTRAVFSRNPDTKTVSRSVQLKEGNTCQDYTILLPGCVEDSLSPLRLSLSFSLTGTPVLSVDSRTSHSAEVSFEKNCGKDEVCEDDLRVKLSFTGITTLVVGESLDVNGMVSVTNQGEDSYNTRVSVPFPPGLSYRKVEHSKKATVLCESLEGETVLTCWVNRPLLRPNTTVDFLVGFHVSPTAALGDTLTIAAKVTSDYSKIPNARMMSIARVEVRYAIYITINSLEESSKYKNFTSSDTDIQHVYRVNNLGDRRVPLSIVFLVPVRLGEATIWKDISVTSSQANITECTKQEETEGAKNFQELLNKSPIVNCSVGWCVKEVCQIRDMEKQSSVIFTIRGTVTKDWTTQTEQKKIFLQSSAEILYDIRTYHQSQHFSQAQAQTVLEVIPEYNYFPIIIGSSVGGLVLLALITAALYKLGFFKRQYKEMLENPAAEPAGDDAAPVEPQNIGETK